MLKTSSNGADLMARLAAVPDAARVSTSAALAAYVRARTSGVSKGEAMRAHLERTRIQRQQPDRAKAVARFDRPTSRERPALAATAELDLQALQQGAVQGALRALGRSS